jgi:hypothetical protein
MTLQTTSTTTLTFDAGRRATILLALLPVLLLAVPPRAAAATTAGVLIRVINDVRGTPPNDAARAMVVGDPVLIDTWLETGEASGFTMTFDPEGVLRIGAETRLVIDQVQIDAVTGRAESRIEQTVGWLRLQLSRLFSGRVQIDTPTATLGAKGTDLIVIVEPDGTTRVLVIEGVVTVASPTAPEELEIPAGSMVVVRLGEPPSQPAPYDPSDVTTGPNAGGPDFDRPQESTDDPSPAVLDVNELPIDRGDPNDSGIDPNDPPGLSDPL